MYIIMRKVGNLLKCADWNVPCRVIGAMSHRWENLGGTPLEGRVEFTGADWRPAGDLSNNKCLVEFRKLIVIYGIDW